LNSTSVPLSCVHLRPKGVWLAKLQLTLQILCRTTNPIISESLSMQLYIPNRAGLGFLKDAHFGRSKASSRTTQYETLGWPVHCRHPAGRSFRRHHLSLDCAAGRLGRHYPMGPGIYVRGRLFRRHSVFGAVRLSEPGKSLAGLCRIVLEHWKFIQADPR
jgi:hypothetical protein